MKRPEFIARHGRCPSGWMGRMIASLMARETAGENRVALELLGIERGQAVLEVGFGHGRTLASAAKLSESGRVAGVDISPEMVAMAGGFNRELVSQGRVDLSLINGAALPFEAGSFDRVLSVHTIYFWENPVDHLREIHRVLRMNGRLVLGLRFASDQLRRDFPATLYTFYDEPAVGAMLATAGFRNIERAGRANAARGVDFMVATR